MEEVTYLFIDGGYLRAAYRETVQAIYGENYRLDFRTVFRSAAARKAFYYDCLDDHQKKNESEQQYDARLSKQQGELEAIRAIDGMHVRLGHLSGEDRRQKEVDVQLAVDMLTHAFNRNMTKAVLIAGDRDFVPVVRSLVQLGTFVELRYVQRHISKELRDASDALKPISIVSLCDWTFLGHMEEGSRWSHFPVVQHTNEYHPHPLSYHGGWKLLKEGYIDDSHHTPVELYLEGSLYFMVVKNETNWSVYQQHKDPALLERIMKYERGPVVWNPSTT